jgi:hypothetical protein
MPDEKSLADEVNYGSYQSRQATALEKIAASLDSIDGRLQQLGVTMAQMRNNIGGR